MKRLRAMAAQPASAPSPNLVLFSNFSPDGGAASSAIGLTDVEAEGLHLIHFRETVAVAAGPGSVSYDLGIDIPDGALILAARMDIVDALTGGGTTAKVGLGTVADPDKYLLSAALTAETVFSLFDANGVGVVLSADEDIQVNGATAAGAIGDSALTKGAGSGNVIVDIWYWQILG